jgi:hypothetical protein
VTRWSSRLLAARLRVSHVTLAVAWESGNYVTEQTS